MTKPTSKNKLLALAALSSTFFVTPLALATTFGPGATVGPILTSNQPDNIVQILPTGQITTAGAGVLLNSANGVVITDPNNTFVGNSAINTVTIGIDISAANGQVEIGTASGINAIGTAINVQATAPNTQITNNGTIITTGNFAPIFVDGNNAILINNAGSFIQQASTDNPAVAVNNGTNFTMFNLGTITRNNNLGGQPAVRMNGSFNQLVNESGGIIQSLIGGATAYAIDVINGGAGDIINNTGGLIYSNSVGGSIHINAATTGNIFNDGTLQADSTGNAILLSNNINSIVNTGNMTSATNPTILTGPNVQIPGMITNSGNITNLTGTIAINLSAAGTQATYVQNAGNIVGNIFLAPLDSNGNNNVFFMNGGSVFGSVVANAASVLELRGGIITGSLSGSNAADTFNFSGTKVAQVAGGNGNDIFNVTGGDINRFLDGGAGIDILNFKNSFTANAYITNIESINVNSGTLTLNNQIINMGSGAGGTGLIIDPGATLNLNSGISGQNNITNNGTFNTNTAEIITLTGTGTFTNNPGSIFHLGTGAGLKIGTAAANGFTNQAGSAFVVDVASATEYGHLIVNSPGANSVQFNAGSIIKPQVKGFISNGAVLNIVTNKGIAGTIADNSSLSQSSAVIQFSKSPSFGNFNILLTARRNPYEIFAIDPTQGLASALDFAAQGDGPTDPNLLYLLGQIDGLATANEVSDALISLTPPSNNGLVQASFIGMNSAFERINERMYDLHLWMQHQAELNSGVNSGDKFGVLGFWAQALGAHLNQHERDGLAGYDANSGGLALGVDWRYNDCTALGFAISYNKAKVNDNSVNPKDEDIRSWQGTSYAWIDYANGMYVNAIMGLAFNDYDVDRTIRFNLINTVSNANFNGWQFGLQSDAGWFLINNNDYFITPFARLKYTLLDLDNYSETGAGPLSLTVENESIDQLLGGVGVKFGKPFTSKHLVFIPELTTMLSYDFINDGEQSTANFVGNGLSFATDGVIPGRVAFNLGVGVSTHIDEQSIFTIKYDLTLRDKFNANSGYLEYYYLWG